MKNELTEQQTQDILQALDKAIESGPWEESNFLRVIGKNLQEIRSNFLTQINKSEVDIKGKQSSYSNRSVPLKNGQQEVFIALYSTEGNNLQSWERILSNLPHQMVSRPVYANEEDVIGLIKSKENKITEAYVAVYINQMAILPMAPDKILRDKFGKSLLSLKDRSLSLENINRFVHLSNNYRYVKGRLLKYSNEES